MDGSIKVSASATASDNTPAAPVRHTTWYESIIALTKIALLLVFSSMFSSALADEPCKSIQFKPGTSSIVLSGTVPPEGGDCYLFSTRSGQTVKASIESEHDNVIFSILEVVDAVTEHEFKSKKTTYEIRVGQLFRSVTPESYQLTLSIK